jgi:hypothetical protein
MLNVLPKNQAGEQESRFPIARHSCLHLSRKWRRRRLIVK